MGCRTAELVPASNDFRSSAFDQEAQYLGCAITFSVRMKDYCRRAGLGHGAAQKIIWYSTFVSGRIPLFSKTAQYC